MKTPSLGIEFKNYTIAETGLQGLKIGIPRPLTFPRLPILKKQL
jgi:hypothetical protein